MSAAPVTAAHAPGAQAAQAGPALIWQRTALNGTLGPYAAAWDDLSRREFADHPLLAAEFVDALLDKFGEGREHLCIGRDDQGVVRALCILQAVSPMVWRSFLPSQAQLGPALLHDAAAATSLFRCLPRAVLQIDLLCCDPDITAATGLHAPTLYPLPHALTVSVPLAGGFDAYLKALAPKLRSNIKRYFKRCAEDGRALDMRVQTTSDQVAAAVDRYAALETSGWKGQQGTALGSSPQQLGFYRQLLATAAAGGRARAYELYFGDQLVASRLTYQRGGMLVMLKTTYDETEAKLAPGRILLHEVLRREFGRGEYQAIEFYTDANADLIAWSTRQRWIRHLSLYRSNWGAPLLDAVRPLLRRRAASSGRGTLDGSLSVDFFDRTDDLPESALDLLRQCAAAGSYLGPDWYRNLEQTVFTAPGTVQYAVLSQDGQVLGVLPLAVQRHWRSLTVRGLTSFYTPLYQPALEPMAKPLLLAHLLKALRARYPDLRSLDFSPMATGSHGGQVLLAALRLAGLPCFEYFCFDNWQVGPIAGWSSYLAARSRQLRSLLARKGRHFAGLGGRFELLTRPDDLERGLAAYTDVYTRSWKRPEPFQDFVPGLLRTYLARGELRLGLALLHDRPVAAQIWIVANGRAEIHKLAYDDDERALSPGSLLSEFMMRHVIEQDRVTEIDYLIGDDRYKQMWMDARRERWGIVAYNPSTLSGLFGLMTELLGRQTKGMRQRLRSLAERRDAVPARSR